MPEPFTVVVMAAGRGTRMRSALPKVLHPVCGKPMVEWVIDAARAAGADRVICVVRPDEGVGSRLPDGVLVAEQVSGEGTGAAVLAARDAAGDAETVVVLSGDHPLVSAELLERLVANRRSDGAAATLLTTDELDPDGYGRVVRAGDGSIERIVETKDPSGASADELAIREINIGTYAFSGAELWEALERVGLEAGERYLTGLIPALRADGKRVSSHPTRHVLSAMGVNDRAELMEAEELAQRAILEAHGRAGVTFLGPRSTRVEAGVEIGQDTVVWPGVTLRGATRVGSGCEIGPCTTITDSAVGDRVHAPHSYMFGAMVDDDAMVGPFAHLRPDAHIGPGAKIGTFVEVKNAEIGAGAKVPHLSYLGDADVGEGSNIAAGNITANYDGRNKHRTRIGKGVRTSVDTSFVAPVDVGDGAYTGAGSVITEDVPEGALGIARSKQTNIEGYAQRKEKSPG